MEVNAHKEMNQMSKNWQVLGQEKRDPAWLHQAGSEEVNGQKGQLQRRSRWMRRPGCADRTPYAGRCLVKT